MSKKDILYIELKTGFNHTGPAWISRVEYSKSGNTIYFNGSALKKYAGITGNYYDLETEEEYGASEPNKNGRDRHKLGTGLVFVDSLIAKEYMLFLGMSDLDPRKFKVVQIQKTDKSLFNNLENESIVSEKQLSLTNKSLAVLKIEELGELVEYYEEKEFLCTPNKARKGWQKAKEAAIEELSRREIR